MEERYTVAGMLRTVAGEAPGSTMFVAGDERRTWAEQYERSCRVARALEAEGLGPGDRVAFLDRNGLPHFDVLFGGALLGAVNVAVNWRLSPVEIAGIVDDAEASVLVVDPDYLPHLAQMPSPLPSVRRLVVLGEVGPDLEQAGAIDPDRTVAYEGWLAGHPATDPGDVGGPDAVSLQLYTSGTTGLPKGVMLTNANLATAIGQAHENFEIGRDTVSLVAMPLFHIGGVGWALCAMSRGGTSIVLRDVDPKQLLELVEGERITDMFVVPAVLMFLLATEGVDRRDFSSLRRIFYGASPIAEDVLVQSLEIFGCDFCQLYGMTETTGAICALGPEDHDPDGPRQYLLRSAGKALGRVELRIVDAATLEDQPTETTGEIWTRSPYNMAGYWEKPDDTAKTLVEGGWLRTGDAGYLDKDGYLFLQDRIKDMIVSGGENVYPAEVENALLSHPTVVDAAVIGVPDAKWGETVKAVVVRAPDGSAESADLIAYCRTLLAHYKCPTSVDFVEALPRNPSGKVLKRELRDKYWADTERHIN